MTAKLAAASVRLKEAESLLARERSAWWHSVPVEKDGERSGRSVEGPRRGRGGWRSRWWC
jgi:hypothetical protein